MKYIFTLLISIICNYTCFFQIGVNTNNPKSELDVVGDISVSPNGNTISSVDFYNNLGDKKISLKAPQNLNQNITIILPTNIPQNNQALITDENGNTSWGTPITTNSKLYSIALNETRTVLVNKNLVENGYRFLQQFNVSTNDDPIKKFNENTGTFTAPQAGLYLINAHIVPNAAPFTNNAGYYYPITLEIRKNITENNLNSGIVVLSETQIKPATSTTALVDFTIAINGIVSLAEGDTLNLIINLQGTEALSGDFGISFPQNFTYSSISTNKAVFNVLSL